MYCGLQFEKVLCLAICGHLLACLKWRPSALACRRMGYTVDALTPCELFLRIKGR